jgi:UDP-glucose 4-epimerase
VLIDDVGSDTDWSLALKSIDVVVHLVARTHVLHPPRESDPIALYRTINLDGTRNLARQAAASGVRRFVFVSSIKVNGERTSDRPFTAHDLPAPEDAYGISKYEAELALMELSRSSSMDIVIVRPPLIHGPGVKGNLRRLMSCVAKGVPLPLRNISNCRSMVGVANLSELIMRCVEHPSACNRVFLVKDDESLSTPALVQLIARLMERRCLLLPFPAATLRVMAQLFGRKEEFEKLCGSLEVDDRETRQALDWQPKVTVYDGIRTTVEHFLARQFAA